MTVATARDPVTRYAEGVLAGQIVTGPWVRLACRRHRDDLTTGAARGLQFDPARAQLAIDFFEQHLYLTEDRPFLLEPWQQFLVGSLFGWIWTATGLRRYWTAYIEVGKGNGKTPLGAGIALYGLVVDSVREPGAEIYCAATQREQAAIAFRDAHTMAECSPALASRLLIGQHNLANPATRSFLRAISAESRGLDGKRVHMAIIDELHEHPNNLVVSKIAAGTKGRRQPLILEITNSGYDRESVCWQHRQQAIAVLEGRATDDRLLAYICALDEGDDWRDPAVWIKANPNLGVSVTLEYLAAQVAKATAIASEQSLVCRLNFCVWTEQRVVWIARTAWDACAGAVSWTDLAAQAEGAPAWAGLDLASTNDLAALVLLVAGPPDAAGEPTYDALCWAWCPEATVAERVRRSGVPYDAWVRDGALTATPGTVIDYRAILATLGALVERYQIRDLGYDRWGSTKLVTDLEEVGFSPVAPAGERSLSPVGQGFASLSAPTKELEILIGARRLRHGGHPVLTWAMGNVVVDQDPAGNLKPSKSSSSEKIDPAVALILALSRAMVRSHVAASIYEERDVVVV